MADTRRHRVGGVDLVGNGDGLSIGPDGGLPAMSALEDELVWQVKAAKLPAPVRELTPIAGRRYRFDLCWPDRMLACEVQGGVHSGGRHVRGVGAESDAEKLTLAVLAGYRVLLVTAKHIKSGQALNWIEQALNGTSRHDGYSEA